VTDPLRLEQSPDIDGTRRREAAVRIDELCHALTECSGHVRHDRLRPARPFIDVPSALGPDAPLEGIEAPSNGLGSASQLPGVSDAARSTDSDFATVQD